MVIFMKQLTQKAILSLVVMSVMAAAQITMAQQLAPQKVLDDLTAEQTKQISALGRIPNHNPTSPAYDYHLSKILTPAQAAKYNQLKDGNRDNHQPIDFPFNIDSK